MVTNSPSSPETRVKKWHPLLRAFRHRNYKIYILGQLVSVTGTWVQIVAQAWLVYRLSHSALTLGLVGFIGQMPIFLLGPVAGVVADRYPRRRLLLITQTLSTLQAVLLAALTLTDWITVPAIFVLAFLLGILTAFDFPVRQAFVVELVGREDMMNAIALNTAIWNGARVVGPALAGIAVAALGEGLCFAFNAVSFFAVIISLLLIRLAPQAQERSADSHLDHFREGWKYVWNTMPVRSLLLLLGTMSLVGYAPTVLMPIFAEPILGGGPATLGWLMGSMGLGSLLGGLSLASRRDIRGLGKVLAVTTGAYGVALILFSLSTLRWLSIVLLVPVGYNLMRQSTANNSLLQYLVPDSLRGRLMSFYSMMWLGMTPIASLLAGAAAASFGAPQTLVVGGFLSLLAAAVFGLRLRRFWHVAGPILAQQSASFEKPLTPLVSRPETEA